MLAFPQDSLGILDESQKPRYQKVADLLKFGTPEIAQATGVPKSKVLLTARIPPEIADRFVEWAIALNLVAQYFQGDPTKTSYWFTMRNPLLGGLAPRDMIRVGRFWRLYQFIVEALAENE